jgi:cell wall-associated NlpC family hydrolase
MSVNDCLFTQDCYHKLMRISRQWRHLKNKLKFGFANTRREASPGDLAYFCPTCPQPGVNLPLDWVKDTND